MSTTKRKTSTDSQWPYIRFSEKEKQWKVDARTKEGGQRRFFDTKGEAQTHAQQCRIARQNHGNSAFGHKELAAYGKSVHDAVMHYLEHLRREEKSTTVSKVVDELIAVKTAARKSARYIKDLRLRLGRFAKDFGSRSIASITTKELDVWLSALDVHAQATKENFRRIVRVLFSFAVKRDYIQIDPAKKTENQDTEGGDGDISILTPTQTESLLKAAGPDVLPFIAIGAFAGLRVSEIARLDWAQVNLGAKSIEIKKRNAKTKTKRRVPICDALDAWIRPLAKVAGPVAPVGLRKRLDAVRESAGLSLWPSNALRHGYGSYRMTMLKDRATVSYEMGNTEEMVKEHYENPNVTEKDAAAFWKIKPSAPASAKIVAMRA